MLFRISPTDNAAKNIFWKAICWAEDDRTHAFIIQLLYAHHLCLHGRPDKTVHTLCSI